jgi:hypothetical protein
MPASDHACQSPLNKIVLILRRACGVIFERHRAGGEHQHQWARSRAVHPLRSMVLAISSARSGVRG